MRIRGCLKLRARSAASIAFHMKRQWSLTPLVFMLVFGHWNESAEWAKQYLTEHPDDQDEKDAFYHLCAVSGSRNAFIDLPEINGMPQFPRRSQEVQDMHSEAACYVSNREAAGKACNATTVFPWQEILGDEVRGRQEMDAKDVEDEQRPRDEYDL